jgi:hypothetical protein
MRKRESFARFAAVCSLAVGLASAATAVTNDKTVAGLWRFDHDDKAIATDESSFKNDGEIIGDVKWHHLTGVREGAAIRFYVDGERVAEGGNADFDVGTNAAPLHMMSHLNRWLVGALDDVIILRRALPDGEVKSLMRSGAESYLPSPRPANSRFNGAP